VSDGAVLEKAAEWMVQINDSAATEADFIAWQAWLGESPEHAQAYTEIEDTWRRSAAVSQASASKLGALRGERSAQRSPWHRVTGNRAAQWAAAASLVLALAGGGYFATRGEESTIRTATAELRSIRLPDGSRAALGPETNVQIAFSERHRGLRIVRSPSRRPPGVSSPSEPHSP
jgi:transmembrane sensor